MLVHSKQNRPIITPTRSSLHQVIVPLYNCAIHSGLYDTHLFHLAHSQSLKFIPCLNDIKVRNMTTPIIHILLNSFPVLSHLQFLIACSSSQLVDAIVNYHSKVDKVVNSLCYIFFIRQCRVCKVLSAIYRTELEVT